MPDIEVKEYKTREEIEGRMHHLQDEMHTLFKDHPQLDFNADQVKAIREANSELSELGKKLDDLSLIERMRQQVEESNQPRRGAVYGKGQLGSTPLWKKSLGTLIVESDAFKRFDQAARRGPAVDLPIAWILAENPLMAPDDVKESVSHDYKALLDTSAYVFQPMRLPGIPVRVGFRTPFIQNMIPSSRTAAPTISYLRETTATSGAAAVAEGATKPESTFVFQEATSPVRKIATTLPVTDEMLDDAPALQGYLDNRLRFFLQLEWERQLLLGSGVAPNLTGIMNTAGLQTQARGTDPGPDAIYRAGQKIRTIAFAEPTAVVMHPDDWTNIRLLRTPDGVYIWGNPQDDAPERIWGWTIRQSPLMTADTALVGAFDVGAQQFIRQGVAFSMSTEHSTFFVENKVMLLVEMRLALAVLRPTAFCTVTDVSP